MNYAVIMAGGAGTRLWPMSRAGKPKQLLPLIEGRSLLNLAASRLRGLIAPQNIYVCTGAAYVQPVLDDLATLPAEQVLGEPEGRDTANAVGLSAAVLHRRDPEAALAVLTADHVITPVEVFQQALATAFAAVEKQPELLVTFGITPTYAATGYGYLERGAAVPGLPEVFRVAAFREKPNAATAEDYVKSGNYLWNSGMFVWKVRTILEQLKQHLPESYAGLMEVAAAWDTPEREGVLRRVYPGLPKISIDFAVMEKAPHVACVPMPVEWLDVGSWPSYAATLSADADGNRQSNVRALHLRSQRTLVVSEQADDHLVATVGLHDVIIVRTPEVTLVCAARGAEHIKELVAAARARFGDRYS